MRSEDSPSLSKTLSLGFVFIIIWAGFSLMPQSMIDMVAASCLQAPLMAFSPSKESMSPPQNFHSWVQDQMLVYEESEQKHQFLLEKSPFYHEFEKYIEKATPGWILYRPKASGSSVAWIKTLEPVQKGSAVILGDCVVGFVDIAYPSCARVRLVTDTRSKVAVEIRKSVFGDKKETQDLTASMKALSNDVAYWQFLAEHSLFEGSTKAFEIQKLLKELQASLQSDIRFESTSLQGLLKGSADSWRYGSSYLVAEGFYRQIETSEISHKKGDPIQIGDLLVTSGLDGRYPPGLRVGYVTGVFAQDPAHTLFEVKASCALADFSKEKWVWVLPIMMLEEVPTKAL